MSDAEQVLAGEVRRRAARRRLLLLLDFDGTLCEFDPDPEAVVLPAARRAILRDLQQHAIVGIVSGRRLADVRARCGIDGIVVAGLHGLEIEAAGEHYAHPDLGRARSGVADVIARLRESSADLSGVFVEDKELSVALHFREASDDAHRAALEAFSAVAGPYIDGGRLRVMRGSKVLELLPNIDWNKGDAVRWIRDRVERLHGSAFVVYVGDDVTDQDAFAAVGSSGMPIAASDRVHASARLEGPAGVERFLSALRAPAL